jgi:uncharacterized membrane protein
LLAFKATTASGILIIAVSIPLVFNKIPPNHIYGFRLKKAFESEQNWYAINQYGAKVMIVWSCIMIAAGEMIFRKGISLALWGDCPPYCLHGGSHRPDGIFCPAA